METFADWPLWQQILTPIACAGWLVALVIVMRNKKLVVGRKGGGGSGDGGDDKPEKPEVS